MLLVELVERQPTRQTLVTPAEVVRQEARLAQAE